MTALGSAMDFLRDFGFFDVVLPFLLVFTIVFGILDKTRIFGVEKIDGADYPKKNLNAMVAFVIAFFVIAAKEVVQVIQVSLPQIALGLIIIISFLMLAGSFMSDKEFNFEGRGKWVMFLTGTMFLSVALIFLNALGWLDAALEFVSSGTGSSIIIPSVIFLAVVIGVLAYVVGVNKPAAKSSGGDK